MMMSSIYELTCARAGGLHIGLRAEYAADGAGAAGALHQRGGEARPHRARHLPHQRRRQGRQTAQGSIHYNIAGLFQFSN
jgi:hypothetical protein